MKYKKRVARLKARQDWWDKQPRLLLDLDR